MAHCPIQSTSANKLRFGHEGIFKTSNLLIIETALEIGDGKTIKS
jgi:hypothetical protein